MVRKSVIIFVTAISMLITVSLYGQVHISCGEDNDLYRVLKSNGIAGWPPKGQARQSR